MVHYIIYALNLLGVEYMILFCNKIFSTKSMRGEGGYEVIKKAIEKLGVRHKEHIAAYGDGNERRLTGRHETADINTFLWVKQTNVFDHPYSFPLLG